MKKVYNLIGILFLATNVLAQNVGIGTTTPLDKLHVNGTIRSSGINIINTNVIELGYGLAGKETNAGKIGYSLFSPASIDFVGAGTSSSNRKIRLWAEGGTTFEGPLNVTNINTYSGLSSQTVNLNAYTKLGGINTPPAPGSVVPAIKTMVLYSTTDASYNNNIFIPHGLNWNQILSVRYVIKNANIQNMFTQSQQVNLNITPVNIMINIASPASSLLGMPIKIFVTYQDDITDW